MLSEAKKWELARQFICDCEITDSREIFETAPAPMYLVEDTSEVEAAFIADLEGLTDEEGNELFDNTPTEIIKQAIAAKFEGEDLCEFLDRHGIKWE